MFLVIKSFILVIIYACQLTDFPCDFAPKGFMTLTLFHSTKSCFFVSPASNQEMQGDIKKEYESQCDDVMFSYN